MLLFEECWLKICQNEKKIFKTIHNKEFTYVINNNILIPSRTDRNISKSEIEKAFNMLPLDGPGEINDVVQGPAYVWAILNDSRIM